MNDLDSILSIMSNYDRYHQDLEKLSEGNKGAVFDILAKAHITQVLVEFDGEGDSGQINGVTAIRNRETVALPAITFNLQRLSFGDTEPATAEVALREAIETLCYDYLEVTHGGWENNDGAFGEFRLDVATRMVELEFNARYIETSTSDHTF
jgi:hypothetical protein